MYPTIQLALSPDNQTVIFVSDGDGNPHLSYNRILDCFIRVLDADVSLEQQAKSESWEIREAVACHSNVTAEILAVLARDAVKEVRAAAMQNPKCPVMVHKNNQVRA
jgi:hypothetical protein